jgi:hypothetical protein
VVTAQKRFIACGSVVHPNFPVFRFCAGERKNENNEEQKYRSAEG